MAKHITGLIGADEGDRLWPIFLHFFSSTYVQRQLWFIHYTFIDQ